MENPELNQPAKAAEGSTTLYRVGYPIGLLHPGDELQVLDNVGVEDAREIGRGGTATVYSAIDPSHGPVAVKVLRLSGRSVLRRFDREVRILAALHDVRGVVKVLRSGVTADGEPFLVMPLMSASLRSVVDQNGPLPWVEAVRAVAEVAETLEEAHERGVIHADIKPDNILLNDSGHLFVSDFGISKLANSSVSTSTRLAWTPAYAAPELFDEHVHSRASDIYSLGATLVGLIIGRPPFSTGAQPDSLLVLMNKVLNEDPPDLAPYVGSDGLNHIVNKSMAKLPEKRFDSSASLAFELRRVLLPTADADEQVDEQVKIHPTTDSQRSVRTILRPEEDALSPVGATTEGTGAARSPSRYLLALSTLVIVALSGAAVWYLLGRIGGEDPVSLESAPESPVTVDSVPTETTLSSDQSVFEPSVPDLDLEVNVDGSAEYTQLSDAIRAAEADSRITIGPGHYVLTELVELADDITLIGSGHEATIIEGSGLGVLQVAGAKLALESLTLTLNNDAPSLAVVTATDAVVEISDVKLAGASENGLLVQGSTTGWVRNATFSDNGAAGASFRGTSTVQVFDSTALSNGSAGFEWGGQSQGSVTGSSAERNAIDGFLAYESAAPTINLNTANGNTKAGFAWLGRAGGSATDNVSGNNFNGFAVLDAAAPDLVSNTASENSGSGFAWSGRATGSAIGNTSQQNSIDGFAVAGSALPSLVRNHAEANVKAGFAWLEMAEGEASANTAYDNGFNGFAILGDSSPLIESNVATENLKTGFRIADSSSPRLEDNSASGNTGGPILIEQSASPDLSRSSLQPGGG